MILFAIKKRNVQANNRNQPRQTNFPCPAKFSRFQQNFPYPAKESNNFKSRPGNRFQQPAIQAVQQPPAVSAGQSGQLFQNPIPNFTQPNFHPQLPAQPTHYPPQPFQQIQQNPQATQRPPVHTQQMARPFQHPPFFSNHHK